MTENTYPLHTAIIESDEDQAKQLIINDTNLSELNADDWSPLHLCAQTNNARIARWLINAGAKINVRNSKGVTALHSCAWTNSIQVATIFLTSGSNPNLKDDSGWTPLMLAAWNNHFHIIELLLKNGASINARSKTGSTALHFSAYNNAPLAVELLLDNKAATNIINNDSHTAYALALRKKNGDCAVLLQSVTTAGKEKPSSSVNSSPIIINTEDYFDSDVGTPAGDTVEFVEGTVEEPRKKPAKKLPFFGRTKKKRTQPTKREKVNLAAQMPEQINQQANTNVAPTETAEPSAQQISEHADQLVNKNTFFLDSQEIDMPFLTELTKEQTRLSSDGNTSEVLFPEQRINLTINGESVRRKSETVIANLLFSFDLNYVYERKLCGTVAVGINYPAFTIFTRDDRIIIWEHVSGLDSAEKRKQFNQLKRWYRLNGFIEGETFFSTQDTVEGGVDSPAILEAVEQISTQMELSEKRAADNTNTDGS